MTRLGSALRLATGDFIPFLSPGALPEQATSPEDPQAVVRGLEARLARQFRASRVVATNLGRTALELALRAADLPAGSEVLIPSFACAAIPAAVLAAGCRPVLVDVDAELNPSLSSMKSAMGPRVKAAVIVHLAGGWARDTLDIVSWCKAQGLLAIEDAAQALGLVHEGRPAGSFGDAGIFSAGLGKSVFCAAGGWVAFQDPDLAAAADSLPLRPETEDVAIARLARFVRTYRSRGAYGRQVIVDTLRRQRGPPASHAGPSAYHALGISGTDAAMILDRLGDVPGIVASRKRNARLWLDGLERLSLPGLRLPGAEPHAFENLLLTFHGQKARTQSAALARHLFLQGIQVEGWYTPLHRRPEFARFRATPLPITEARWAGAFAVPIRPDLTEADRARVAAALETFR